MYTCGRGILPPSDYPCRTNVRQGLSCKIEMTLSAYRCPETYPFQSIGVGIMHRIFEFSQKGTEKKHVTFTGKTLLITGGTGSFGNAVLNRFLRSDLGEIRIFTLNRATFWIGWDCHPVATSCCRLTVRRTSTPRGISSRCSPPSASPSSQSASVPPPILRGRGQPHGLA